MTLVLSCNPELDFAITHGFREKFSQTLSQVYSELERIQDIKRHAFELTVRL